MSILDKANKKKLNRAAQVYQILWELHEHYSLSSRRYSGLAWNVKPYEDAKEKLKAIYPKAKVGKAIPQAKNCIFLQFTNQTYNQLGIYLIDNTERGIFPCGDEYHIRHEYVLNWGGTFNEKAGRLTWCKHQYPFCLVISPEESLEIYNFAKEHEHTR